MSGTIKLSELVEILECPICYGLPHTSFVYQCTNGHTLCQVCRKRLGKEICPSCRQPLGEIRNRTIERIMEFIVPYHCRFKKHGCALLMTKENLLKHEEQCEFRDVFFPTTVRPFKISLPQLVPRLKASKALSFKGRGKCYINQVEDLSAKKEWLPIHIVFEKRNFFLLLDYDSKNYNAWMYLAGTVEESIHYSCSIELYKSRQKMEERIKYTGPPTSLDIKVEKKPIISFDSEQARSVALKNKKSVKIIISHNEKTL